MRARAALAILALALTGAGEPAPGQTFQPDGTVNVPAFQLPPSPLSSPEAQAQQRARARMPVALATGQEPDIALRRAQIEAMMAPRIAAMRQHYPVDIADDRIGGVPVKIVTPAGRTPARDRVLINLHGGAFNVCWPGCGLIESIPIAALGGYRIVTVDYRMAPEHKHPAGVEDAASVFRALQKTYRPARIGVFGCSAGGALTAQLAALLATKGERQPGAIGIFGAGAIRFESGDSSAIAAAIDGSFGPPVRPGETRPDMSRGYFDGADLNGPVLVAARHPEILAKFPPSLLLTGTRAMDMSPAIFTNSRLLAAGVESTLIVGEGMGHCYIYSSDLPEARDAYAATVAFFGRHLH